MSERTGKIAVLIVAGGCGQRMNAELPKQYLSINGKPILRHTIEKFTDFSLIQCAIAEGHEVFYAQAVNGLNILPYVYGGGTRQKTVMAGLKALKTHTPDYILIHDAARPCINAQDIHNIINRLKKDIAATLAMPVSDSLQRCGEVIDRDDVWMIQTPQVFDFNLIYEAHIKAEADNFQATDDTAIARYNGATIEYIPSGRHNIKITTQDDLKMARILLQETMETRVGSGFDVHAFDTVEASSIRLCGLDIPHDRRLKGHSDADVGLHALTDAIFGAMGAPDIGQHFPPSDEKFKNMDSQIFLDKSVDTLRRKGGSLTHVDVTFICEEPKIGKHRNDMIMHLSKVLNLSTGRISVKATTSEQLGFTGRREGIACQAVATIKVPADD